ncbi:MAG TPA: pilus assembly PilX N-terminal domain-containing protein [Candidatus Acidoferrum sp.]|nr:pilus assembly PilX N-terminal domain-containing protein [Candidatus Acidoferrum sp.]
MRTFRPIRRRRSEAGIALLIAIFVLLLISVVGIAVVVSSDTESHLTGNYRSSTEAYYDALAGVEEARARLRPNDPNSFKNTWAAFYTPPGATLPIGTVGYVLNPSPSDNAGAMLTTYPDLEYDTEFGPGSWAAANGAGNIKTTLSIWNGPLGGLPFPGPLYKWVRINAISEKSLNLDVDADGQADSITPLYYGSINRFSNNNIGPQALELTALAVLPNNTQKLLQYVIAPVPVTLPIFTATLTIPGKPGNSISFSAPASNLGYKILGNDQDTVGACAPGAPVDAVDVFNNVDQGNVINGGNGGTGIPAIMKPKYTGYSAAPDVNVIAIVPPSFQSPAQLEALVQAIFQNADVVINASATGANLPAAMYSGPNPIPMTTVVNGDLDLTGWNHTGYGLLLVRGNLNYDPDASWDGIVMVVGQGTVTGTKGGSGEIDGAFLLAKTLDAAGNPLSPNFGTATMIFGNNMGGEGMRYSSCWIAASQPTAGYKILSFHEISQ